MMTCDICKKTICDGEERELNSKTVCEDCCIDALLPRVRKMFYENDRAEFMRRLKDSYPVRKQRYH